MILWCCTCQADVEARLTNGAEVYPHRPDLATVPRWIHDACGCHVGTHHKTNNPTRPLGNIPSHELKMARQFIHELIDPAWKSGKIRRSKLYDHLSEALGYQYHTAELKTLDEARRVYRVAQAFLKTLEG